MTTATNPKIITPIFHHENGRLKEVEYKAEFDGNVIGFFPTYLAAEEGLNDHAMRLIEDGLVDQPLALMAAVPDGTDDDDFSDCPAGPGEPERAPLPNGWMQMPEGDILDTDGMRVHLDPDQGEPEPWPGAPRLAVNWNSAPTARIIPVADLHMLAQTDPALFRAKLAALSSADLRTQATLYSIYASMLCDREISVAETLEHFRLSVDVHRATQRSEDRVCAVIYEMALTDAPAMIEFLHSHTDAQREALAERFAAWLDRECEIHREPSHILRGWQALIVGMAASGADQLRIELADCLGFADGWDAVAALWRGADATVESYASL